MNITLVVLLVEAFVILFGVVGFLFFLRWKRGKVKTAEFETLLDTVSSKEGERKAQLIQFLEESHALKTGEAEESAGYMIEAEKQFLQQLIKQQLEQTSITGFYTDLCELLDNYLYFVPTVNIEQDVSNDDAPEQQENVEVEVFETDSEAEIEDARASEEPEAKDSGETHSEKEEEETEPEEPEVTEEALDWGDAFSESGDEMDEETKASFESETKS